MEELKQKYKDAPNIHMKEKYRKDMNDLKRTKLLGEGLKIKVIKIKK